MLGLDRLHQKRVSRPFFENERVENGKIVTDYPLREDGSVKLLDVDQFSGQKFMLNVNGFITNDIMVFEECQSDSVARAVLQRLKILHPQNAPQDLTEEEMLCMCMPANYGSPAEFVSANKSMVYKLHEQRSAMAEKLAAQKKTDMKASQEAAIQDAKQVDKQIIDNA